MNSEDDIDSSVSDCLIGLSNLFQYSEYNRRVHDQLI